MGQMCKNAKREIIWSDMMNDGLRSLGIMLDALELIYKVDSHPIITLLSHFSMR